MPFVEFPFIERGDRLRINMVEGINTIIVVDNVIIEVKEMA